MFDSLQDIRNNKKFLSSEQTRLLINVLTLGCNGEIRLRMGSILRNTFYSLDDKPYWKRFLVEGNYLIFKPLSEETRRKEIKEIRDDILLQRIDYE